MHYFPFRSALTAHITLTMRIREYSFAPRAECADDAAGQFVLGDRDLMFLSTLFAAVSA
jgi:hypothetical protein